MVTVGPKWRLIYSMQTLFNQFTAVHAPVLRGCLGPVIGTMISHNVDLGNNGYGQHNKPIQSKVEQPSCPVWSG